MKCNYLNDTRYVRQKLPDIDIDRIDENCCINDLTGEDWHKTTEERSKYCYGGKTGEAYLSCPRYKEDVIVNTPKK